ncbi:MAG: glycosyltransferase family 4 protein [Desulfobacteraceae bacterium]|nr:glycosyltransferase family 4 protein [Desulfobacteraceae bacterium]
MSSRIRLLVNAIPMVNVNTGISRYLRSLYAEMGRVYGDRLEIGYFDGAKVSSMMPVGPANLNRWTKGIDLFWRMPVYPALIVRLGFHFVREAIFRRWSRHFEIYHEAGFFPFAVPRRLKTVFTIHDLSLIRFPQYHPEERVLYSRLFFRRRCNGVDHFLAVSEFTAREMRARLNINPENISVTREAHDDKIFFPRSHEEVKAFLNRYTLPERYFLFVGGGDPRKNLDVVPEALKKAGIEVPLVVVGWSGWSDEKSWKNVIPLGYVSDDEMAQVYSGALALIFPSSYEGFGLPILEAMACGCPVVTTREASLPEVAGEGAIFMKGPRDVDDLAGILRDLAGDPAVRQRLRDEGQARARRFSWEETAQRTFEAFEAVLK